MEIILQDEIIKAINALSETDWFSFWASFAVPIITVIGSALIAFKVADKQIKSNEQIQREAIQKQNELEREMELEFIRKKLLIEKNEEIILLLEEFRDCLDKLIEILENKRKAIEIMEERKLENVLGLLLKEYNDFIDELYRLARKIETLDSINQDSSQSFIELREMVIELNKCLKQETELDKKSNVEELNMKKYAIEYYKNIDDANEIYKSFINTRVKILATIERFKKDCINNIKNELKKG